MKKSEKIYLVQDLIERLKQAKGVTLVDYQGLTVSQVNKLRQKIKQADASFEVIKNRLLKRALNQTNLKVKQEITGSTALILANKDEIGPLKAILESIRQFELPKFKFGFLNQSRLESQELEKLAVLPSCEQLLAQLTATLAYPARKLVYSLNYNRQKLVVALTKIKNTFPKGGDT